MNKKECMNARAEPAFVLAFIDIPAVFLYAVVTEYEYNFKKKQKIRTGASIH